MAMNGRFDPLTVSFSNNSYQGFGGTPTNYTWMDSPTIRGVSLDKLRAQLWFH